MQVHAPAGTVKQAHALDGCLREQRPIDRRPQVMAKPLPGHDDAEQHTQRRHDRAEEPHAGRRVSSPYSIAPVVDKRAVADAAHGLNRHACAVNLIELGAQIADIDIDDVRRPFEVGAPDRAQQARAGEHVSAVSAELLQSSNSRAVKDASPPDRPARRRASIVSGPSCVVVSCEPPRRCSASRRAKSSSKSKGFGRRVVCSGAESGDLFSRGTAPSA